MEYAEELLSKKDACIKDVSMAVGYGDTYYFCKIFKKVTGLTPKQHHTQKLMGEM
jgi:two-component system response regulator YesN